MTPIAAPLPSERWFEELVARGTADRDALERLGIAEFRLGVEIVGDDATDSLFGIEFDGYDITAAGQVDERMFAPDVVLSGSLAAWAEMVAWIVCNGSADSAHSINGLTITGVSLGIRSSDAMGSDKIYRYMGTLQALFDAAGADAAVPTTAA